MMKTHSHLWILIVLLVSLSFACELINWATNPANLRVESVDVSPSEGSGKFGVSVGLTPHDLADKLTCNYLKEDGSNNTTVYDENVPPSNKTRILTFDFTLTNPGKYKLYCTPLTSMITGKTTFTVTGPIKITGTGQKISLYYALSEQKTYSCGSAQEVTLTVQPDGSAELYVVGPGFVDHYNCTQAPGLEGWSIAGTANTAEGTATFTSCNKGGFDAQGKVDYADGILSGQVSCLINRGENSGKPEMTITIP